jgi:hypothetical protein
VSIFAGGEKMRPTIRPATSDLYREQDEAIDRDRGDDRLPIQVAVPIIVALSLSLWGGIGFAVSALL